MCAFVPLVYYQSATWPAATQMSQGVEVVCGRRPSAVWREEEGSNKPSLWIREQSRLRALSKWAWLHVHMAPHAQRSEPNQPKDDAEIKQTSRAFLGKY